VIWYTQLRSTLAYGEGKMAKWRRPFKWNDLFRPDLDRRDFNACVGHNGGPYDLYDYAQGYFEATRLLLQAVGKTDWANDLLVYLICLNFRHAIELFIKYLISELVKLTKSQAKFRTDHLLDANWSTAMNLIRQAKLNVNSEEIKMITKVVADIMEVDPNGNIFRYPESIKGDQHLKEWAIINLAIVNDVFVSLIKIVEEWHFKVEGRIEAAIEHSATA
jgi:hypothetical protein